MRIYRGSERGMIGPPPLANSKNSNLRCKILKNMPWTSPRQTEIPLDPPPPPSPEKNSGSAHEIEAIKLPIT